MSNRACSARTSRSRRRLTIGARLRRTEAGQAVTETMIMMMFLLLLVFGFIHMCMLATTKYVVDYAAFSVARADLVDGNKFLAAMGALAYLDWSSLPPIPMSKRRGPSGR